MPELPEVETVRLTLAPAIGARVEHIRLSGKPLRMNQPIDGAALRRAAVGATLEGVRRLGKYLLLDFAARPDAILVHLGMSGRLRLYPASEPAPPHTHVALALTDGRELRFSDPRRFGIVATVGRGREREHPALAGLGPDPLVDGLDGAALHAALHGSRQTVKSLLLDQRVVAGVGNIYASEALHRAGIRPTRRGLRVTPAEAASLARAVVAVLRAALSHGGTSLRDFVAADGREGDNAAYLKVYDRAGEPCPRRGCAGHIRRTVLQGRATFHCPSCQPR